MLLCMDEKVGPTSQAFQLQMVPPYSRIIGTLQHPSVLQNGSCIRRNTALHINWFGSRKEPEKKTLPETPAFDSKTNIQEKSVKTTKATTAPVIGGGGAGTLGGVAGIMDSMDSFRNSQRIGKRTGALLQELLLTTIEGVAENGKVRITLDGQQRPVNTFIDEAYFAETTQASDLAAAITVAMKDAHVKSTEKMDERLKGFYNELGLPSN